MTALSLAQTKTGIVFIGNGTVLVGKIYAKEVERARHDQNVNRLSSLLVDSPLRTSELSILMPRLVVMVSDEPDEVFEQSVLEQCRTLDIPVLPVLGRGPSVLIGPLERRGQPGCATCLTLRWENSAKRTRLQNALHQQLGDGDRAKLRLGLGRDELESLANLVTGELDRIVLGERCQEEGNSDRATEIAPKLLEGYVGIFTRGKNVRWAPIVPSHQCPRCSKLPLDSERLATFEIKPRQVLDIGALRTRSISFDDVAEMYVDPDVGFISALNDVFVTAGHVRSRAVIQLSQGGQDVGYGSGMSTGGARLTAILETMERNCSIRATDRRPVVFGSYEYLGDRAVNPLSFGVHEDALYESHPYLAPYDRKQSYSWVWAYSTREQRPVLVPEQIAYYGKTRDATRFVNESSSGCALGGSFEEAVLHGIFEVLERDGLLNTWYCKMRAPELQLGDDTPPDVSELLQFVQTKGYRVHIFNVTHDLGIPALMAVAVNEENRTPKVVCGSSCHLNAYEAARGALRELAVQALHMEGAPERRIQEGIAMLDDPAKIRAILDHVVATAVPDAYGKWSFLLDDRDTKETIPIDEEFSRVPEQFHLESRDIGAILRAVLEHIHAMGFDVIVVNQTNIEAKTGGFHVVKALIPGMTPITFGYGQERFVGLKRIYELPRRLGYSSRVLTRDDLNYNPHPLA